MLQPQLIFVVIGTNVQPVLARVWMSQAATKALPQALVEHERRSLLFEAE